MRRKKQTGGTQTGSWFLMSSLKQPGKVDCVAEVLLRAWKVESLRIYLQLKLKTE